MSRGRAAPEPAAAADGAARGPARAWSNAFIAGFLLLQVLVPLRYYAAGRGSDERFAWRFFSTAGMRRCDVRVGEAVLRDGGLELREVKLASELPSVWIGLLRAERPAVVEKLLRRRCESSDVREVLYRRTCFDTDGTPLPPSERARQCRPPGPRGKDGGA